MGHRPGRRWRGWAICSTSILYHLPLLESSADFMPKVAKLCGFKVLGSCSPANNKLVENVGADATFNYKIPVEEQIKEIGRITSGKFSRVFDTSAFASETGLGALAAYTDPDEGNKYFATTNGWSATICCRV
jgi:hypothetical protein